MFKELEKSAEMIDKILSVIRSISEQGKTVFLIEHDMQVVMEISDFVIVLHQGKKIATGKPKEIQNNQAVLEAYLSGVSKGNFEEHAKSLPKSTRIEGIGLY